jgi:hypothetical protein
MIFDIFLFNNEIDLLKLRLKYIPSDIVILGESEFSFTSKPKPLHFFNHAKSINKYMIDNRLNKKIMYLQIPYLNSCPSSDDDFVIFSDADEIPNIRQINAAKEQKYGLSTAMSDLYFYFLNYKCVNHPDWYGSVMGYRDNFKGGWNNIRQDRASYNIINTDRGWHFSYAYGHSWQNYLGKVNNYSHSVDAIHEESAFKDAIKNGTSIMKNCDRKFEIDNSNLPFSDMTSFKHLIYERVL